MPFATLVLRMSDISISDTLSNYPISNATGSINQNRTSYTFKNVNLRAIVGNDIFDKYDYFNMRVAGMVAYMNNLPLMLTGTIDGTSYMCCRVFMSGPNFINNTYNIKRKTNTGSCCIAYYNLNSNSSNPRQALSYDESYIYTIKKTECFDITISYLTMDNKDPAEYIDPAGTDLQKLFPRVTWILDFIPIREP